MPKLPNIKDSMLSRIWEELKHINYQQVNEKAARSYTLCVAGTRSETAAITAWLGRLRYPLLRRFLDDEDIRSETGSRMRRRLRTVTLSDEGALAALSEEDRLHLRDALLTLTTPRWASLLTPHAERVYVYEEDAGEELADEILTDLPNDHFALSYVFPAFRAAHARREIRATAMQNSGWALFTAAPNIVPNPGQVFTIPAEALSDFVVLTVNEIKMMFELVALTGRTVQPLQCIPELGIILGLAKLAETTATNLVGKAPGAGPVIKGGVAYAFTSAIGEAIFLYEIAGVQVGKDFLEERAKAWFDEGKRNAARLYDSARNRLKK
ncbi:MAG: hypothetical protein JXA28_04825 [Bacteroidetes bacterium]|nr:hypothetical protein [Bacteroidota bacterium]